MRPSLDPDHLPAFQLRDAETGTVLGKVPAGDALSVLPIYSDDGRHIVLFSTTTPYAGLEDSVRFSTPWLGGFNKRLTLAIRAYEVPSLRPSGPGIGLEAVVQAVAVSRDGRLLALLTRNSVPPRGTSTFDVRLWDLAHGREAALPYRLPPGEHGAPYFPIRTLVFGPDGRRLLGVPRPPNVSGPHGSVHRPGVLIDTGTLRPVGEPLWIPQSLVSGAIAGYSLLNRAERLGAFSADSRLVALADGGSIAQVFDAETGRAMGRPLGHTGRINAIHFHPDGLRIATAGADGVARLWDSRTGQPIGPPMPHPNQVDFMAFSPAGLFLATHHDLDYSAGRGGGSHSVRLWDAETAQPLMAPIGIPPGSKMDEMVAGPGPRRLAFGLMLQSYPLLWDVPIERRLLEQLEDLAIVLSAHRIDSAEGFAPATVDEIEEARSRIIRSMPDFFEGSAPAPNGPTK
jgi:WD40 repeat protein